MQTEVSNKVSDYHKSSIKEKVTIRERILKFWKI